MSRLSYSYAQAFPGSSVIWSIIDFHRDMSVNDCFFFPLHSWKGIGIHFSTRTCASNSETKPPLMRSLYFRCLSLETQFGVGFRENYQSQMSEKENLSWFWWSSMSFILKSHFISSRRLIMPNEAASCKGNSCPSALVTADSLGASTFNGIQGNFLS